MSHLDHNYHVKFWESRRWDWISSSIRRSWPEYLERMAQFDWKAWAGVDHGEERVS